MSYDPSNVFAKILRGEIPAQKVYEDDHAIVIMDAMPQSPGHSLVISKAPSRNLLDADPAILAHLLPLTQKIARAVKAAFSADGVALYQFNEAPAGQSVFHFHIHVVPRFEGVAAKPHGGPMEKPEVLAEHAAKLRAALA